MKKKRTFCEAFRRNHLIIKVFFQLILHPSAFPARSHFTTSLRCTSDSAAHSFFRCLELKSASLIFTCSLAFSDSRESMWNRESAAVFPCPLFLSCVTPSHITHRQVTSPSGWNRIVSGALGVSSDWLISRWLEMRGSMVKWESQTIAGRWQA